MGKKGFVYIMTNDSMPGIIKVGMSTKVPTERAKELEDTGLPMSYVVQYYAFFDDMRQAEKKAHNELSKYHYNKEFFKTDVGIAIYCIENTGVPFKKLHSKPDNDRKAEEFKQQIEEAEEHKQQQEKAKVHKQQEEKAKEHKKQQREVAKRRGDSMLKDMDDRRKAEEREVASIKERYKRLRWFKDSWEAIKESTWKELLFLLLYGLLIVLGGGFIFLFFYARTRS